MMSFDLRWRCCPYRRAGCPVRWSSWSAWVCWSYWTSPLVCTLAHNPGPLKRPLLSAEIRSWACETCLWCCVLFRVTWCETHRRRLFAGLIDQLFDFRQVSAQVFSQRLQRLQTVKQPLGLQVSLVQSGCGHVGWDETVVSSLYGSLMHLWRQSLMKSLTGLLWVSDQLVGAPDAGISRAHSRRRLVQLHAIILQTLQSFL